MSDVRKKIDLAFKSNVKDLIASIKDLQTTIENVKKAITDLNAIQENNTKAANKRLDETNKKRTKNINLIKKETNELINQSKINQQNIKQQNYLSQLQKGQNLLSPITRNLFESDVGESISSLIKIPGKVISSLAATIKNNYMGFKTNELQDMLVANQIEYDAKNKTLSKLNTIESKKGRLTPKQAEYKKELETDIDRIKQSNINISKKIGLLNTVASTVAAGMKILILPLKNLGNAIETNVKEMLNFKNGLATINMSTSLISNTAARNLQMQYGLTSSTYYGATTAANMLNIRSEEDFMYMNSAQRTKFLQYMEQYSAWYTRMSSSGVLENIQDMQLEFAEFKQELSMEFLSWVAENKEPIMTSIKFIMKSTMVIAEAIMNIVSFLSGSKLGLFSDKASNSYQSRNLNITVNSNATFENNNNGVTNLTDTLADNIKSAALAINNW